MTPTTSGPDGAAVAVADTRDGGALDHGAPENSGGLNSGGLNNGGLNNGGLGERAIRTRGAILDASRKLFLERGYAGTRINNITDACGISRAGFYTYFKDKHEVFEILGESAYREKLQLVGEWESIPRPCGLGDVVAWIRDYFAYMDVHGAFIFSASQSPPDEAVRVTSRRLQMRVAFLLGVNLRGRQVEPTDVPESLGLAMMAMLERSWYHCRVWGLPVDEEDMIRTLAETILRSFAGSPG